MQSSVVKISKTSFRNRLTGSCQACTLNDDSNKNHLNIQRKNTAHDGANHCLKTQVLSFYFSREPFKPVRLFRKITHAFCENLSSCVPTLCLHFFCDFNVREYNWKCLSEMSSRKTNANRTSFPGSCGKAGCGRPWPCVGVLWPKCKVVSKFKRLQVSLERMLPRKGVMKWLAGREGRLPPFPLLKCAAF